MRVVILNWSGGTNDPFTFFNQQYARLFARHGKDPLVLDIADPGLLDALVKECETGIEFVMTCQGIAWNLEVSVDGGPPCNFWDRFGIPLLCLHADHPSHDHKNHTLDSRICSHLYIDGDAAMYSNKYLRKKTAASVIELPNMFEERHELATEGKYFVFAKNIMHPDRLERIWAESLDAAIFDVLMEAVTLAKERIAREAGFVDFHQVLDDVFRADERRKIFFRDEAAIVFHHLHANLDKYVRNFKSLRLIESLADVPVRIHGEGWDEVRAAGSPKHEFLPGLSASQSRSLFYSEYGILDVSPFRGLHDRSLRAIANETPFLSSADLVGELPEAVDYGGLFYDMRPGDALAHCERVMAAPREHRDAAKAFARLHKSTFRQADFVHALELHAKASRS